MGDGEAPFMRAIGEDLVVRCLCPYPFIHSLNESRLDRRAEIVEV
jgi:hypothetical protein